MRSLIQLLGAELRERRQVAILRQVQAQSAGHLPHRLDLRIASDAAHGNSGVDRGADAAIEKVGFEEYLAVGDRNHVRRNVRGNVAGLRFDYRQRRQRTRAQRVVQFRGALQQARMQEENVAGKRFAAGRTPQQQRNLAVRLRVLRKVIVKTDGVALGVAEIFADRARREGRDVLHGSRFGRGGRDHDGVLHCAEIGQRLDHLRHRGAFLADRAVNANQIAAALIQNRIQNDGGFADLPVTDDQFALAAADGNHRVNGLDARLNRFAHRLAINYARRQTLQREALARLDRPLIVNGIAERIHDAPDQSIADRHGHDFVGALDDVAFADFGVIAEQHRAHLVFFQVQRDAEDVVRELDHFAGHALVESMDARDSVAHGNHRADFLHRQGLLVIFDLLAQNFCDLVRFDIRHSWLP